MKLHVAIDRVRDPSLIPQDKPWTIKIYRALADEFRSYDEFKNAIEVYADMLEAGGRWIRRRLRRRTRSPRRTTS